MMSVSTAVKATAFGNQPHVCVCICTYKRPALLQRLLDTLEVQKSTGFTFSVVVADNDEARSAERLVDDFARRKSLSVVYCSEPRRNIALVRNKALENAHGDFIAFIDDDEFPSEDWLGTLLKCCSTYSVDGALGPVRPHFDEAPPSWLVKGRFCERPEHPSGTNMEWTKCRTGNVLFRRSILPVDTAPFREEFGTGGEDQDFFRRMSESGRRFVWCNEAVVYETVPPGRWTRSYMFKRALLRGRNVLKHPTGRVRLVMVSLVATPIYSIILPATLLVGQHVFVKYAIRLCDHTGRLLAAIGLNPLDDRQM
jgi:succinoglycan biosynthesis protein ExoM